MTPAARLAAAIELLAEVEDGRPPERALSAYFRSRRYAGSKDRRAVADTLFGILRHRAWLAWRSGGRVSPRALALGWHVWSDEAAPESLATAWESDRFAPAPPDPEELAWLAAPVPGSMPDTARLNCPEALLDAFSQAFGEARDRVLDALNRPAPLDLRVNRLKADREGVLRRLRADGLAAEPTPLSPWGVRLPAGTPIDKHRLYAEGRVEVQDEGSQLAAALVGAAPGEQVLDLCAGAGGKSLALAASMENRGQIFACDTDARRLEALKPRLKRAGVRNLQPHLLPEDGTWPSHLPDRFDKVVIDAPCGGSGAWRRRPADRWRFDRAAIADLNATQDALLRRGAGLLAPGGALVYITCSLLPAENEARIAALCAADPGLAPADHPALWQAHVGTPAPRDGIARKAVRLDPARHDCDGFFIAVLTRAHESET